MKVTERRNMDYRTELKKKLIEHVVNIDTDMVNRQIKQYLSQGYTYEQIYNALVYWYEVKGKVDTDNVAHGGIGILKYIFNESEQYWAEIRSIQEKLNGAKVKNTVTKVKARPMEDVYRPKLFNLG